MTIAELVERARAAGLTLDVTDDGLAVEGYLDDHPALLHALATNKGAIRDALILAGRLATGWTICAAEPDPVRRTRLEDHWITLLHEYEAGCDREPAAPNVVAAGAAYGRASPTPTARGP